jgi:hypothetical protein
MKLLREIKKHPNYVTLCRIQIQEVKTGVCSGKYPLYGCFASFIQLKITPNSVTFRFVFETGYYV